MKRNQKKLDKKYIYIIIGAVVVIAVIIGLLQYTGVINIDNNYKDSIEQENNNTTEGNNTGVDANNKNTDNNSAEDGTKKNGIESNMENIDMQSALKVYFIDVGQGDSILIRCVDGTDILFDAGHGTKASASDEQSYLSKLQTIGLDSVDYLIATHPDSDHINMLDVVLENYEVKNVYSNYQPKAEKDQSQAYKDFASDVKNEKYGTEQTSCTWIQFDGDGDKYTIEIGEDCTLEIFAPGYNRFTDVNASSPISILSYSGRKIVLTGDASTETESWFITAYANLGYDCDVLKSGHHGSKTASSDAFLDFIDVEYAVISCGAGNSYGHPHQETTQNYANRNYTVYRTDEDGTITLYIDGDGDMAFCTQK